MNITVRYAGLILFAWLMFAGVCCAKQIYLKDGSTLEGQSVWRQGNKVFVKVNRDIVAEFAKDEVDMGRSFPASKTAHKQRRHGVVKGAGAAGGEKPETLPPPKAAVATPKAAPANTGKKPVVQPPATPAPAMPSPGMAGEQQARSAAKSAEATKKALEAQQAERLNKLGALSGGTLVGLVVTVLVIVVLLIASQWIIFQRAGEPGWKCLIPLYNMYILMQICGKPGWWMFLLFVPLVGLVVYLFAMLALAKKFGKSELYGVGLLLLPMIFFPLLAFGKAEYEG